MIILIKIVGISLKRIKFYFFYFIICIYYCSLVQNKAKMVELGVDDKLIDMMNVETFPVVFKLLGTLRMLLDKQGLYVELF